MGLALVETNLGAALHVSIKQSIDDEKRAFDATDFTQGKCKLMLAWTGCKLLEQLTGWHDARRHCGHGPQDTRPILDDETLFDFAADKAAQLLRRCGRIEEVQPFRRQIPYTWNESEGQKRGDGKDMVGEAAGVCILLFDLTARFVHQQPVEDVGASLTVAGMFWVAKGPN